MCKLHAFYMFLGTPYLFHPTGLYSLQEASTNFVPNARIKPVLVKGLGVPPETAVGDGKSSVSGAGAGVGAAAGSGTAARAGLGKGKGAGKEIGCATFAGTTGTGAGPCSCTEELLIKATGSQTVEVTHK